jgi:hypothetical protein
MMKLPHITLKTTYWYEKNPDVWVKRLNNWIFWGLGFISLFNMMFGIWFGILSLFIINLLLCIIVICLELSYRKYIEEQHGSIKTNERK